MKWRGIVHLKVPSFYSSTTDSLATAAKVGFPKGFSIRAAALYVGNHEVVARVDKPRKEEAVGGWD